MHLHNYRLLGQFEGTSKIYRCIKCGDQTDEAGVSSYDEFLLTFQEDYLENEATGN